MRNISAIKNCYGCGVCVKACPVKIISVRENKDGFYSPFIAEQNKCIECNACLEVCGFNHETVSQCNDEDLPDSYGGWSNDINVRMRCSSGGIGFEIGRFLITEGYGAIAVRYNPWTNRAEHFIASTIDCFKQSVGSKYIPSNMSAAWDGIEKNKKYMVVGTPCQIDSFRRYIKRIKKEDDFVLIDFFCHGVPSLLLWNKYTSELRERIGEFVHASWRNKSTGWHDSWSMRVNEWAQPIEWQDSYAMSIWEKKSSYTSRMSQGDLFYKFFLDNYCLNDCCYNACKYKLAHSAADIRLGDFWGETYVHDDKGVSAVLVFTDRGRNVLRGIGNKCTMEEQNLEAILKEQMSKSPRCPSVRNRIIELLRTDVPLSEIYSSVIRRYRNRFIVQRVLNRVMRILHIPYMFLTR